MLTTSGDAQNDQVGKLEQLSSVLSSGRPFKLETEEGSSGRKAIEPGPAFLAERDAVSK